MSLVWLPRLTLTLLLGPILAGFAGTLLPALGHLPAIGATGLGLGPFRELFATPGIATSIRLSLGVGIGATIAAVAVVVLFCAAWHGTRLFRAMQRILSPLLSVPHVTVAFGIGFLIAPSGWLLRMLSPWATGFVRPPDWLIVNDPNGISLALVLIVREVPFLMLMMLVALGQADAERTRLVARALGYGPMTAWLKAVLPRVYPQLRLPIFAVLAYAVSAVDVALVIGPTNPPTLAVRLVLWFYDADLDLRLIASAGALLLLAVIGAAILLWIGAERAARYIGLRLAEDGRRGENDAPFRWLAAGGLVLSVAGVLLGLAGMAMWSVARIWRFPDAVPNSWSLDTWMRQIEALSVPIRQTCSIALGASLIASVLTVGCLEYEARRGRSLSSRGLWLIYLPLILPQLAFLFGAQIFLIQSGLSGTWFAVLILHLVFVLPYTYLSLSGAYRAVDPRYERIAIGLGAPPARRFWIVKLPLLTRAVLVASALGFSVSCGQYLPTIFASSGRYATLTTEAVNLSTGADRRVIGVYAILQMLLPAIAYGFATGLPKLIYMNRRAMAVDR